MERKEISEKNDILYQLISVGDIDSAVEYARDLPLIKDEIIYLLAEKGNLELLNIFLELRTQSTYSYANRTSFAPQLLLKASIGGNEEMIRYILEKFKGEILSGGFRSIGSTFLTNEYIERGGEFFNIFDIIRNDPDYNQFYNSLYSHFLLDVSIRIINSSNQTLFESLVNQGYDLDSSLKEVISRHKIILNREKLEFTQSLGINIKEFLNDILLNISKAGDIESHDFIASVYEMPLIYTSYISAALEAGKFDFADSIRKDDKYIDSKLLFQKTYLKKGCIEWFVKQGYNVKAMSETFLAEISAALEKAFDLDPFIQLRTLGVEFTFNPTAMLRFHSKYYRLHHDFLGGSNKFEKYALDILELAKIFNDSDYGWLELLESLIDNVMSNRYANKDNLLEHITENLEHVALTKDIPILSYKCALKALQEGRFDTADALMSVGLGTNKIRDLFEKTYQHKGCIKWFVEQGYDVKTMAMAEILIKQINNALKYTSDLEPFQQLRDIGVRLTFNPSENLEAHFKSKEPNFGLEISIEEYFQDLLDFAESLELDFNPGDYTWLELYNGDEVARIHDVMEHQHNFAYYISSDTGMQSTAAALTNATSEAQLYENYLSGIVGFVIASFDLNSHLS